MSIQIETMFSGTQSRHIEAWHANKKWFLGLLFGLAIVAWMFTLRPAFLGGPASYVLVSGMSMEPTLHTGDLVITRERPSYEVGDVVAFHPSGPDSPLVIHRIIGGTPETGFRTQGDNKENPDLWRPTPGQIEGEQWLTVPRAGTLFANLRSPIALAFIAGVGAFLLVVLDNKKKDDSDGEDELDGLTA